MRRKPLRRVRTASVCGTPSSFSAARRNGSKSAKLTALAAPMSLGIVLGAVRALNRLECVGATLTSSMLAMWTPTSWSPVHRRQLLAQDAA